MIKYRPDIDGLRAIAILSVLIFHIDPKYLSGGFVGVDIFFVISGFLITYIIKNEIETTSGFSFKNFYLRRARRLLPALFVTLFGSSIFAVLFFSPSLLSSFGGSLSSALLSVSNVFFWIEADYFDVSAKLKPLLHTWPLSIEEQFYLFWPLVLLLLLRLSDKKYLFGTIILLILLSLYLNIVFQNGNVSFIQNNFSTISEYFSDGKSTIFFLLPFRVYEFMFGAILVWIVNYELKQKYIYDILFILGLFFIGYSVVFFDENMLFPSYYGIIPVFGTVLLIFSSSFSSFNYLLSNKVFVSIGLISYSLYLVHWPIIVFWNYLDNSITKYDKIYILLLSFVLAYLSYRFVEQPFRKRAIEFKSINKKLLVVVAFGSLMFAGYHMHKNNGWTWRVGDGYSEVVFDDIGSASNFHKIFYGGANYKRTGGINTTNPADIVLIGDSHAGHLLEGLYKVISEPYDLNLYNSSGTSCITLPNFTRTTKGADWDSKCSDSLNLGLKYLGDNENAILIVAASWISQMGRADILDTNSQRLHKVVTREDVLEGILKLKSIIQNKKLVIVGSVPGAGDNLYDIFTRPRLLSFGDNNDLTSYLRTSPKDNVVMFNEFLAQKAIETEKFIFLNPMDVFCESNICTNIDSEKRLIYSDRGHLSKYGSIELIKGFEKYLMEVISK
jgi:peptidoglycan/LPS O-acetylase OafA/YrhL